MKFSPSASERWNICAASSVMAELIPSRPQSADALAGSNAHRTGELVLKGKLDYDFIPVLLSEEDSIAVQFYVNFVREIEKKTNTKALIERSFEITVSQQKVRGTIDCVILDKINKTAYVIDYKNGIGVIVDVINNRQLSLYAMGALSIANHCGIAIDKFEMIIVQPKGYQDENVKTWKTTTNELLPIFEDIKNRIEYVRFNPDEFIVSSECKWCPGLFVCDTVKSYVNLLDPNVPVSTLSIPEINRLMELKPVVTGYFSEVEKLAKELVNNNKINPNDLGQKWAMKKTSRKWIDEKRCIKNLEASGDTTLIKKSLETMAKIQKLKGREWIDENTYKPDGSIVLVPIDDKRAEVIPINQILALMGKKDGE